MRFGKDTLLLYAVTDRNGADEEAFLKDIEAALKGGVTLLQLREKGLSEDELVKEAVKVKALSKKYGVPLIINDSFEAAFKSGADGVHVGIEDAPVEDIRRRAPEGFIIGATAKTVDQAKRAEAAGADYLGVGAVFPSPTKKNAIRITEGELRDICASVSIPAVAIGGITDNNISGLKGCGMAGFAVVSAVFSAKDVEAAARVLKKKAAEAVL